MTKSRISLDTSKDTMSPKKRAEVLAAIGAFDVIEGQFTHFTVEHSHVLERLDVKRLIDAAAGFVLPWGAVACYARFDE